MDDIRTMGMDQELTARRKDGSVFPVEVGLSPIKDTGETLSLRDINRFQFRKNRAKGEVPTTQAGEGEL